MNAEKLREDIDSLFKEWEQKTGLSRERHTFSPDGVVNAELWIDGANSPKILFLLKETNHWCDICEYVVRRKNEGSPKWQTWYNIVRWTYLLRHFHDRSFEDLWEKVKQIDENKRIYNFSRVALVNINKRPGGKSTNLNKLKSDFRRNNKEFLPRQIALLGHLDYIICCGSGVASCLSECECYKNLRWKAIDGTTHRFALTSDGTIVIDFVHPQSREKKKNLFRQLYGIVTHIQYKIFVRCSHI